MFFEDPEEDEASNRATEDWMLKVAKEYDNISKYMDEDIDENDIGALLEAIYDKGLGE